jgi:DNA repair protein RecN (Recombination protein N)
MLQSLTIENYALIDKLHIEFSGGLSIITGETGAGKSILLGALSLILGQRADSSVLKEASKSCVVEGEFAIDGDGWESLFRDNDLDYSDTVTVRRVIVPGGKSRAFVNDLPVTLNVLKELGERLIDIHSQHQNLLLSSSVFQMNVMDAQVGHGALLQEYRKTFAACKAACAQLQDLQNRTAQSKADYDYLQFQYNELQSAQLMPNEQQEREEEQQQLAHAEEIKRALRQSVGWLQENEGAAAADVLRDATQCLQKIAAVWPAAAGWAERIQACRIELRDVADEIAAADSKLDADPARLAWVEERLNTLYSLQKKHHVSDLDALIALKNTMEQNMVALENSDQQIEALQKRCAAYEQTLQEQAARISAGREKIAPEVTQYVTTMLHSLGMPHAVFSVAITRSEQLSATGNDRVQFLFSANKEGMPQEISRVASGGEISRLMLCLKSLLVKSAGLPAIIFDEIDTGVSGEIADKMGSIIYQLSKTMQVINITHLPQIASKGGAHFVVYKEIGAGGATATRIKLLTPDERVREIAKMLSGQNITPAAIANARELLGNGAPKP